MMVRCATGYDGGLPQLVVLEALDTNTGKIRFNVTANETGKLTANKEKMGVSLNIQK